MPDFSNPVQRLSAWKSYDLADDQGFKDFLDAFFLRRGPYHEIYDEAMQRSCLTEAEKREKGIRPEKTFPVPIEQLSPKGLAIISHLYAEKDKTERQPLIASHSRAFRRLVQLIDLASPGTEVTVILQATDSDWPCHKTVFKIKKTATNIQMINMDSVYNSTLQGYDPSGPFWWATGALEDLASANNRPPTRLLFGMQKNPPQSKDKFFIRQGNEYECGTFAIKDARQMNRDPNFVSKIIQEKNIKKEEPDSDDDSNSHSDSNQYRYDIPPEYLKAIQSETYAKQMLTIHGQQIVTLKGKEPAPRTLEQIYAKHGDKYAHHFSEKFYNAVETFVKQNRHDIDKIKEICKRYDAALITQEDLERRYGPASIITACEETKVLAETMSDTVVPVHTLNQDTPEQITPAQEETKVRVEAMNDTIVTVHALNQDTPEQNTPAREETKVRVEATNDTAVTVTLNQGTFEQSTQTNNMDGAAQPLLFVSPVITPTPHVRPRKSPCCCVSSLKSCLLKAFF